MCDNMKSARLLDFSEYCNIKLVHHGNHKVYGPRIFGAIHYMYMYHNGTVHCRNDSAADNRIYNNNNHYYNYYNLCIIIPQDLH